MAPRAPEIVNNAKNNESATTRQVLPQKPSFRDALHKMPDNWLRGKRADDGAEGLWRIYDKLYDFTSFMKYHPGGIDWLDVTKGMDITESFETSHMTKQPEALLKNYYVREAKTPRVSPYTFHEDGFYKTIKRRATPILERTGTGPTTQMLFFQYGLLAAYFTVVVSSLHFQSYALGAFAGLVLSLTVTCAHNFYHQQHSWRVYIWELSLMSSRDWKITHALSHHMFPNTVQDMEITMLEPFMSFLPSEDKGFFARYGPWVYWPFMYSIMLHFDYARRWVFTLTGQMKFRPENLISVAEFLGMWFVTGDFFVTLKMWYFIKWTFIMYFAFIGLSAAHHHPDIYHDGDAPRKDTDWGLNQLDAVRDREEVFGTLFFSVTSYGDHALHHLFPSVDHSRLPQLYPIFIETCKEFEFKYKAIPYWNHMFGKFAQLARNTPNKIAPDSDLSPVKYINKKE